jgi:NIPSNAP
LQPKKIMLRHSVLTTFCALAVISAAYFAGSRPNAVHAASGSRVFELRTYHTYPGKLEDLKTRFRDHTMKLFEKHGMTNVAYWTPADEPLKDKTLVYVISHESRAAAVTNWAAFRDDPEWKKVSAASEINGKIVEKVDSLFLDPTDFSPMK